MSTKNKIGLLLFIFGVVGFFGDLLLFGIKSPGAVVDVILFIVGTIMFMNNNKQEA